MRKVAGVVFLSLALFAKDGWDASVGISYKKGKYGTDNETTSTYFYTSLTYKFYPFSISFSIPYIKTETVYKYTTQINNNNDNTNDTERDYSSGGGYSSYYRVVLNKAYSQYDSQGSSYAESGESDYAGNNDNNDDDDTDSADTNITKTEVYSLSGIGDLTIKFNASSMPARGVYLTNSFAVKLPTAKKGLGTGETDYILEAKIYQVKNYRDMVFYSMGYTITGDATNKEYKDYLYGNVGLMRRFRFFKGGVKLSYTQATVEGGDDAVSVSGFMMIKHKKQSYFYSLALGLTDGAPKFSFSMFVTFPIDHLLE